MSEKERVHFKIALPVELKKQLEHHAVDSRRSLSAEIIQRLETSLRVQNGLFGLRDASATLDISDLSPESRAKLLAIAELFAEFDTDAPGKY